MVAKLWVHAEIVLFACVIPYTFLIGYQLGNIKLPECQEVAEKATKVNISSSETLTGDQKKYFSVKQEILEKEL